MELSIGFTLIREVLTNHGLAFSLGNREEGGVILRQYFNLFFLLILYNTYHLLTKQYTQ
jgi:lipoprotein signal peptidase